LRTGEWMTTASMREWCQINGISEAAERTLEGQNIGVLALAGTTTALLYGAGVQTIGQLIAQSVAEMWTIAPVDAAGMDRLQTAVRHFVLGAIKDDMRLGRTPLAATGAQLHHYTTRPKRDAQRQATSSTTLARKQTLRTHRRVRPGHHVTQAALGLALAHGAINALQAQGRDMQHVIDAQHQLMHDQQHEIDRRTALLADQMHELVHQPGDVAMQFLPLDGHDVPRVDIEQ
jgi:hypothetical protein